MTAQIVDAVNKSIDIIFEHVMKPRPKPREKETMADFTPEQQRRIIDHWIYKHDDIEGVVLDKVMDIDVHQLLQHFVAGDDAAIGDMVARELLKFREHIDRDADYWEHK